MTAERRTTKRHWPKAAVVALGLAGGCLSAVPPTALPPGWSVHFHQDTPYFYNERTGETTWDQPALTATTAAPASQPASVGRTTDGRGPPSSRRRPSPSADAGAKRGWFGFGRGNARPQAQHETPQQSHRHQQQQQQQEQHAWQSRGATTPGRPEEQWQAAADSRGWSRSDQGVGVGTPEGGDGVDPGASTAHLVPHTSGWGGEGGGAGAWDPLTAGSGLSMAAEEAIRGPTDSDEGGVETAGVPAGAPPSGAAAAAAAAPACIADAEGLPFGGSDAGGRGALGVVDERDSSEHKEWWAAGVAGAGPGPAAGAAAEGGDAKSEAQTPTEAERSERGGEGILGEAAAAAAAEAEADEADAAVLPPKAETVDEDEQRAPPSASGGTMGEWFLPSPRLSHGANQVNTPSTWEGSYFGDGVAGAKVEGDGGAEGGDREDESGGEVASSTGDGGGATAEPSAFLPDQEGFFGNGFPSQQQQDGSEAAWDWEDPWGQAGTWGTPAWKTGADGGSTEGKADNFASPEGTSVPGAAAAAATAADEGTGDGGAGRGWGHFSPRVDGGGSEPSETDGRAAGTDGVAVEGAAWGGLGGGGAGASDVAQSLAEARTELEAARKTEAELRTALKEEAEAKAAALAAAAAAAEKTRAAEAFARRQAEQANKNATAAGQWLVTLGLEREDLNKQLAAAQANSTSLLEELSALKESAVEAEVRANSSEAKLKVALEDVQVLDEGLKQFMDSDGQSHRSPRVAPLSWRRVSETYLRPLLPSKLKAPTPEELEALKLNRSLGRALENNTALAEAVGSKDDLIKDLNSRIKQFQLHAAKRKKGYRALKLGLAKLTDEVQAKESMMTILAVCMIGTSKILEAMAASLDAQRGNLEELAEVSREREAEVKALALEVEGGAKSLVDLRESLQKTESALLAVAASFDATEGCVQRWRDAEDASRSAAPPGPPGGEGEGAREGDGPLGELLHELHAAAAKKFLSPLGLEPSTGAITVAVPRAVEGGPGDRGAKPPGFWAGLLNVLCCRRRREGRGGGGS